MLLTLDENGVVLRLGGRKNYFVTERVQLGDRLRQSGNEWVVVHRREPVNPKALLGAFTFDEAQALFDSTVPQVENVVAKLRDMALFDLNLTRQKANQLLNFLVTNSILTQDRKNEIVAELGG